MDVSGFLRIVKGTGLGFMPRAALLLRQLGSPRQSILYSSVDSSNLPNWMTAHPSTLAIDVAATTTPVTLTFANGFDDGGATDFVEQIIADLANAWTGLTPSTTLYLYVDRSSSAVVSYGFSALSPVYQSSAPAAPSTDQHWFDTTTMYMKRWNGSAWVIVWRVFVGSCVTGGSSVTSITPRILRGNVYSGPAPLSWLDIGGLICTSIAGNTTMTITAGAAVDSLSQQRLKLPATWTKLLDVTGGWTAGSGGKGNISASAATTTYFIFLIGKLSDPDAIDVGFDTSLTAANLMSTAQAPGNQGWNTYRRIGIWLTDGSKNWVACNSYEQPGGGQKTELLVPVRNIAGVTNPGTAAVTWTTSAPLGIQLEVDVLFELINAAATARSGLVTSLDQTDSTPSATLRDIGLEAVATASREVSLQRVTSTVATIRYRINTSDASITVNGYTRSWIDSRRS